MSTNSIARLTFGACWSSEALASVMLFDHLHRPTSAGRQSLPGDAGYAEVGRIEVAIPKYRGFHVRPST
jgi:hypothetical protein